MKTCETVVVVAVILCFGEAQGQDLSFGARLFHDKADRWAGPSSLTGRGGQSARDAP